MSPQSRSLQSRSLWSSVSAVLVSAELCLRRGWLQGTLQNTGTLNSWNSGRGSQGHHYSRLFCITPQVSTFLYISLHYSAVLLIYSLDALWESVTENLVDKVGNPLFRITQHYSALLCIALHDSAFTLHLLCIYHCATSEET